MERFGAKLMAADRGGAYVEVPPEVVAALGGKGRIPVRATFDGLGYRGSIVSMGAGAGRVLGVLKSIRDQLGKGPGDLVTVTVEADSAERAGAVPDDLAAALDGAGLRAAFDGLSFSHRRECVVWIEEAKRADTRARRVAGTLERLAAQPRR
ncbi:MAG: YdeI/OmpD-associated family protein [Acidimicrobiia bacterium]